MNSGQGHSGHGHRRKRGLLENQQYQESVQIQQQEQVVHTQEGVQRHLYSDTRLEQLVMEGLHPEEKPVKSLSERR